MQNMIPIFTPVMSNHFWRDLQNVNKQTEMTILMKKNSQGEVNIYLIRGEVKRIAYQTKPRHPCSNRGDHVPINVIIRQARDPPLIGIVLQLILVWI